MHVVGGRTVFSTIFLIFSGLLSGCVSPSIKQDYNLTAASGKAIIVGSATSGPRPQEHAHFILFREGDLWKKKVMQSHPDERVDLKNSDFQGLQGQLFAIELDEGTYHLYTWFVATQGGMLNPKSEPKPLEIKVQSGNVYYIGNLHMNIVEGKNLLGFSMAADAVPEIQDQRDRDLKLFLQRYPQFKATDVKIQLLPLGQWPSKLEAQ